MDENNFIVSARELPHSIEAEQSVLGAIIADSSVLSTALELLKPEYFYNEQHSAIFSIIVRMFSASVPIDIVTLLNETERLHIFENPTEGRKYLGEIASMLPTTANIEKIDKCFNDMSNSKWESVKSFYKKSSYGKLDLNFEVVNEWFNPKLNPQELQVRDNMGDGGADYIATQAVKWYKNKYGLDASKFDQNNDGYIDSLWLIYDCPNYTNYDYTLSFFLV